jgi:hypothetical protein
MIFRVASAVAALALLTGAATVAPAQSFSSSAGLGLPLEGVDARARALGGVGTGLFGTDLSVYNPAGSATIPAATLRAAFQPEQRTLQLEGQPESFTTMRLPLLQAAFRFGERWTGSVAYHGVFDQRWAVSREDTIALGGEDLAVLDHYRSDGGISRLVLSGAFEPAEGLSVGAGVQLYTGSSTREVSRQFERGFDPAQTVGEWSYRGAGVTLGGRWQPTEALVAGAAMEIGGTLDARVSGAETDAAARSYSLPLAVRAGASGRITQELAAVLSADWTGWSAADGDFAAGHGARDSWMVAGGLEWEPVSEGFVLPLRLGGRMAALPFHAPGGDWLDERALSGGVGARLGDGAVRADAALERGWRTGDAAGASEDFWRASISLTVFGR